MAATKTATINLGGFSKQITKALACRDEVIRQAVDLATDRGLTVIVKRDYAGRWQAWCKRATARGGNFPNDYEPMPDGDRRAKVRDVKGEPRVYIADICQGQGPCKVERIV